MGICDPSCVYAIRCKETGRVYVGVTENVSRRVRQHMLQLKNHTKVTCSNVHHVVRGAEWQEDYDTYGEDAFEFYVLEENVTYENRSIVEARWIREYNATDPRFGYNAPRTSAKKVPDFLIIHGLPPKVGSDDSVAE